MRKLAGGFSFLGETMKTIAFDTETHLIKPGCVAPRLVCLTSYDGENEDILLREDAIEC